MANTLASEASPRKGLGVQVSPAAQCIFNLPSYNHPMGEGLIVIIIVVVFLLVSFSPFFFQKNRDRTFRLIASKYNLRLSFHQKENYTKGFGPGDTLPIRTLTGSVGGKDIIIRDVFRMSSGAFSNRYFKIPHFLATESFWQRYIFYLPGSYGRTLSVIDGREQDVSNRSFLSVPSFAKRKQIYSLLESIR